MKKKYIPRQSPLAVLLAMPLNERIEAVATDIKRKRRQFASIPPESLFQALEIPDWGEEGWSITQYIKRQTVEEYVKATACHTPCSDILRLLKDQVTTRRFKSLEKSFAIQDDAIDPEFSFLTDKERQHLEETFVSVEMCDALKPDTRHYLLKTMSGEVLKFQVEVVAYQGELAGRKTPYDNCGDQLVNPDEYFVNDIRSAEERLPMGDSTDELDEDELGEDELDEDDSDEGCAFCGSTEGCVHLLAHIDVTFGEIGGGAFYDLESAAVDALDGAIKKFLRTKKTKKQLKAVAPYRLAALVEEVRGQIGKSLTDEDLRTCYGAFIDYLGDLLNGMPGVIETSYDFEGGPGMSSTYQSYWVKNANKVAKAALTQIEQEARSLELLVDAEAKQGSTSGHPECVELPPTPSSLQIGMIEDLAMLDSTGEWPNIECPKSLPKSAKPVGTLGVDAAPTNSWEDAYYMSSNGDRSHLILWMKYEDPYTSKMHRRPIVWCKRSGVTEHEASIFLLRAWFKKKREEWRQDDYNYLASSGLLNAGELQLLRSEAWQKDDKMKQMKIPQKRGEVGTKARDGEEGEPKRLDEGGIDVTKVLRHPTVKRHLGKTKIARVLSDPDYLPEMINEDSDNCLCFSFEEDDGVVGASWVKKWCGLYFVYKLEFDPEGPFTTFEDALKSEKLCYEVENPPEVTSDVIPLKRLKEIAKRWTGSDDTIFINGDSYTLLGNRLVKEETE